MTLGAATTAPASAHAPVNDTTSTVRDITHTSVGKAALANAIARFEGTLTHVPSPTSYKVLEGVPQDETAIWILPAHAPLPKVTHTSDGFSINTGESTPADATGTRLTDESDVSWWPAFCWERFQPNDPSDPSYGGWSDMCQQWGEVVTDNDPDNRNYVYKLNATCAPNDNWVLRECGTGVTQSGDASKPLPTWKAWAPAADSDGPCRDVNLGVTIAGVSIGGLFTGCEQIAIDKGATAPNFRSVWKMNTPTGGVFGDRASALQIGLSWPNDVRAGVTPLRWVRSGIPR